MRRLISSLFIILLLISVALYSATGTPSNLVVRTDANNALVITSVTQVNPVTSGIFSSRVLRTDTSGNLQVILSGTVTPTYPQSIPASTCAAPSLGMSGGTTTGIAFTATPSILNCIAGVAVTTLTSGGLAVVAVNGTEALGVRTTGTTDNTKAGYFDNRNTGAVQQYGIYAYVDSGTSTTPFQTGGLFAARMTNSTAATTHSYGIIATGRAFNSDSTARAVGGLFGNQTNIFGNPGLTFTKSVALIANAANDSSGVANIFEGRYANTVKYTINDLGSSIYSSGAGILFTSMAIVNMAPSSPVACTSPTVTWSNGTATFQIDVGTTCAGVSTLSFTMPASTNGWECSASNTTTAARDVWATAWTTTSVTFTNTARTTGLATDWADGADVRVKCMAG